MKKPVNRIEQYYTTMTPNQQADKFKNIEFEKFDPRIIQNVEEESLDEDGEASYEDHQEKSGIKRMIISQDSQLLNTLSLWIGHCKQDITRKKIQEIIQIEGVETLDVITRYRFRVGVGKLFKDNEVKHRIAKLFDKKA